MLFYAIFSGFPGGRTVHGEGEEKSGLALLMGDIDKNYKILERLSTYFAFEEAEKELAIYRDASTGLMTLCKTATTKFARPDDDKYQEFNNVMLTAAENIAGAFGNNHKTSSLEDVLWQTGLLRQSCADCHKHLGIITGPARHDKKGKS